MMMMIVMNKIVMMQLHIQETLPEKPSCLHMPGHYDDDDDDSDDQDSDDDDSDNQDSDDDDYDDGDSFNDCSIMRLSP